MKNRGNRLLAEMSEISEKLFAHPFKVQCGAICHRFDEEAGENRVALLTSRGTGRWVIPKGWPMKGKKPEEAATIEAWEEAGLKGKTSKTSLGSYTYVKDTGGSRQPVTVDVFPMRVTGRDENFKEAGQRRVVWVSLAMAATMVDEPELRAIFRNLDYNFRHQPLSKLKVGRSTSEEAQMHP